MPGTSGLDLCRELRVGIDNCDLYVITMSASDRPEDMDLGREAGADAYVCAHLLRRILQEITVEQAVKWSSGPALLYMCFMRKHKGTPWKDVPRDYLDWVVNKSDITDRDIRATAKYYLTRKTAP